MSFLSLQFAGYLATGLMAGVTAGLFGLGGGMVLIQPMERITGGCPE